MFTSEVSWTVLQGILWFLVFTFILQFHPQHAAAIGLVAMLIFTGTATLALDSMMTSRRGTRPEVRTSAPIRASSRPMGTSSMQPAPAADPKAEAEAPPPATTP